MKNSFIDFTGRVCLITGAGSPSGIGFCTAKILGELGAKVALVATTDRIFQRAEELCSLGIYAKGYIADLMDRSQVEAVISKISEDFGSIDVLVNNAGMTQVGEEEDFSDFMHVTYERWDTSIDRNLNITFNVTKCVLPLMVENKYGRIVNVSSVTGPVVSNPGEAAYSAAKAAVIGMSKAIAIEVGTSNITVNNVLPGWIATASQTESEAQGGYNTPMRRSADAAEVANAIVFLASDKASYITGESLVVDGGNTIQEYKGDSKYYY
ncbi:MAG: SDR family NAD(P)-dependent oxidoreductase [Firmicutes bacterium]|nr:SDR family NAD(P)-dependent oxidoreductase [Bacillota bacterium]